MRAANDRNCRLHTVPDRPGDIHPQRAPHLRDGGLSGLVLVVSLNHCGARRRGRTIETVEIERMPNLGHFAPLALHLLSLSLGHSADVIRSCGAASEWSVEQRYLFIGFRAIETFRIFSLVGRGAL